MELTPQFFLDKFLEIGRALERSSGILDRQSDRLDHLDERVEALENAGKTQSAGRAAIAMELLKGGIGAIVGAIATIIAQHFNTPAAAPHQ